MCRYRPTNPESCIDANYTDFVKAFETVDHSSLLRKTSISGISKNLLLLLESNLEGRMQFISHNNFKLYCYYSGSRIPQV